MMEIGRKGGRVKGGVQFYSCDWVWINPCIKSSVCPESITYQRPPMLLLVTPPISDENLIQTFTDSSFPSNVSAIFSIAIPWYRHGSTYIAWGTEGSSEDLLILICLHAMCVIPRCCQCIQCLTIPLVKGSKRYLMFVRRRLLCYHLSRRQQRSLRQVIHGLITMRVHSSLWPRSGSECVLQCQQCNKQNTFRMS